MFLTEEVFEDKSLVPNAPKVAGRIITTLEKAKEIRPLVEKCITIAKKGLAAEAEATKYATSADRGTDEYKKWRKSPEWKQMGFGSRSRCECATTRLSLIGDKKATNILFTVIAPRFEDRNGGYTRILRLAKPRLGDAGTRAILEFVGKNDRTKAQSTKPAFNSDEAN